MRLHFPDRDDILNFELKIEPDEGVAHQQHQQQWGLTRLVRHVQGRILQFHVRRQQQLSA